MYKLYKRFQRPLKTIIKMVHRTIHEDHQPSQEFMKGYLTRFIKIMSCTKSSEKSISKDSRGSSIARRILKVFMTIISRTEGL
jgi:hypothetical protein